MYGVLPIPTTKATNLWGVYVVFKKTGLPPSLVATWKTRREARRFAGEMYDGHLQHPERAYTWQWTAIDDDTNYWWKGQDEYAREQGIRPVYREGGRVVILDYGDGVALLESPMISVLVRKKRV